MKPVREVVGHAVPLDRSDVDTDQIIPSDWLKRVERTGFGEGLFSEWRESSDFVLNRPTFQGEDFRVLVAGPNFGTGSSHDQAVWALQDYGFEAIIAPRFGDIFRTNTLKGGLVPVVLPEPVVRRILDAVEDDPTLSARYARQSLTLRSTFGTTRCSCASAARNTAASRRCCTPMPS